MPLMERIEYDQFESKADQCPANKIGKCTWQPHYNQHVNDMRYADCDWWTCPICYWIQQLQGDD